MKNDIPPEIFNPIPFRWRLGKWFVCSWRGHNPRRYGINYSVCYTCGKLEIDKAPVEFGQMPVEKVVKEMLNATHGKPLDPSKVLGGQSETPQIQTIRPYWKCGNCGSLNQGPDPNEETHKCYKCGNIHPDWKHLT